MIHTTAKVDVVDVTFIPEGRSEPETNRLAHDQFLELTRGELVDHLLEQFDGRRPIGEVISIIYVDHNGRNHNLYGAKRYGL